jgi:hypothetical protein
MKQYRIIKIIGGTEIEMHDDVFESFHEMSSVAHSIWEDMDDEYDSIFWMEIDTETGMMVPGTFEMEDIGV